MTRLATLTLCSLLAAGAAAAAHAQTAPATPESVYTALTGRIDTLVGQNQALADSYAKLLACSRQQKFYAPDMPGADAQGCSGGSGGVMNGGGHWAQIPCPSSMNGGGYDFANARMLPECPSTDMQGRACGDIGQRCKLSTMPIRRCHLGEHENTSAINGFVCQ